MALKECCYTGKDRLPRKIFGSPYSHFVSLSFSFCLLRRTSSAPQALQEARKLAPPIVHDSLNGEDEGREFWDTHARLLQTAWMEWEELLDSRNTPLLDLETILDNDFRRTIDSAWQDPLLEKEVKDLCSVAAPYVYRCQIFSRSELYRIRSLFEEASSSGIPMRRPNGMNRYGMILHPPTIEGAVKCTRFEQFYHALVDNYLRPVSRLLFSRYVQVGDDSETYAFTIRYKEGEDTVLKEHADASLFTINVNLNIPEEQYSGSTLYFVESEIDERQHNVTCEPGMALFHMGQTRHASYPLQRGERTNMVIWMFGEQGYVRIAPYGEKEQLTRSQRWTRLQDEKTGLEFHTQEL